MSTIPVFHSFARSGGTLVNQLLGAHPQCLVLSEVNPAASFKSVAEQAVEWRGLCRRVPLLAKLLDKASDFLVRRAPAVYEIYFKDFDSHAEVVLGYIQDLENVVTIGRRGLFLQGDMHQSVEMGLEMGKRLAENQRAAANSLGKIKAEYVREYVRYLDEY